NRECATCHNSSGDVIPVGLKIRNLNKDIVRGNATINQLNYFQNIGILSSMNPSSFSQLPNSHNTSLQVSERARAYLDVNCAHCHNKNGNASGTGLYLGYDIVFNETHILNKKNQIVNMISAGDMPRLGTTTIDEESLKLIKTYIENL
ncbi:MAG: c-type cytochrome, partial [Bacteroidetes bacterium]|nr:c-type cytochrome [Bacteroidota bacterium]